MEITNVKGTHDVVGKEANSYIHIEDIMRALSEAYGFNEFRPPVIESSPLFVRGVGESSDIVRKEMYDFLDKGGRSITLRPEFTAGIVRSFVNAKMYATSDLPVKAYYCGPVFRYERPQLGRYRQFEQFGIEILGTDSIYRDVEAIHLGCTMLSALGLEDVTMYINSLGDEESRIKYKEALKAYFLPHLENMCEDCKRRYELNPLRILDCKVPEDAELAKNAPKMSDFLSDAAKEKFKKVQEALDGLGIKYVVDPSLVRGLDYYAETVFEFHYTSKAGKNYGAIAGGGHYDKLINEIGGPKGMEGVGFSFGIERMHAVLIDDGILKDEEKPLDIYVMPIGEDSQEEAMYVVSEARLNGYTCDINLSNAKMGKMFNVAEKRNAKLAIILGESEIEKGTLILKDLTKKEQKEIFIEDLIPTLDEFFNVEGNNEHSCNCGCGYNKDGCACARDEECYCKTHGCQCKENGCCCVDECCDDDSCHDDTCHCHEYDEEHCCYHHKEK